MSKTGELSMTNGDPYKLLIKFSLPLLLGNIFQQLYSTVDTLIVGHYIGDKAIAAVGAGMPFMMVMISLFMGFGIGANIIISQYYGAGDYEKLNSTVGTIYFLNIILSVPMTIIGILFAKEFLILTKVPDDGTLKMATQYLSIVFLGILGTIGFNANSGILQGLGDSKSSVRFLIISTIINIFLDIIFVGSLGFGVAGAALATILSQLISWILGILYINKYYDYLDINLLKLKFDKNIFAKMFKIGIPMSIQNAMFSFGVMIMKSLINGYGSAFMAGFTVGNIIDMPVFFVLQSLSNAVTTFTGQNIGGKRLDRINEGLKAGLVLAVGTSIIVAAITLIFSRPVVNILVETNEAAESAMIYLRTVVPFYFIMGVMFTYNSVLRGTGKSIVPMLSSMLSLWLLRVPMSFFFAKNFGIDYIYFSYSMGWVLGCIISAGYFHFGSWKKDLNFV